MSVKFNIGDHSYIPDELKQKLEHATPTFNWSGARKIHLADEEEYKYDDILAAIGKTIKKEKNLDYSSLDNDVAHDILTRLKDLKDAGHERTGFLHNLFRRVIPNIFRGGNFEKIERRLNSYFPSTEQLKSHISTHRGSFSDEKRQELAGHTPNNLNIRDLVLLVDYYIANQDKEKLGVLWSRLDGRSQVIIARVFGENSLHEILIGPNSSQPLPSKAHKPSGQKKESRKEYLGKGATAEAVYAYNKAPDIAVKKAKHTPPKNIWGYRHFPPLQKEFEIGNQMDHPVLAKSKKLEEKQKGNGKITFKMHMERIEGQSIYDVKLSKEQAITLLQEAKSCCLYLINENIIWKDVNDGNIFFTNEGHLKICDFGFWRKIEKQSSLSGISMMGGCT